MQRLQKWLKRDLVKNSTPQLPKDSKSSKPNQKKLLLTEREESSRERENKGKEEKEELKESLKEEKLKEKKLNNQLRPSKLLKKLKLRLPKDKEEEVQEKVNNDLLK